MRAETSQTPLGSLRAAERKAPPSQTTGEAENASSVPPNGFGKKGPRAPISDLANLVVLSVAFALHITQLAKTDMQWL